jgi:hypothetical protein
MGIKIDDSKQVFWNWQYDSGDSGDMPHGQGVSMCSWKHGIIGKAMVYNHDVQQKTSIVTIVV